MTELAVTILRRISADLSVFNDGRNIPEDTLDYFIVSLELVYRELIVLETMSQLSPVQLQATANVRECLSTLRSLQELHVVSQISSHSHIPLITGMVGRPSFDIPCAQLLHLIENRFSVLQIASMLGVSIRTIRRRMSAFGLSIRAQYSDISDSDLDQIVREVQQQFPTCGNRQMQGHLLARGYRIQQICIRESQRRIDPDGAIVRRLHVLNRREYSVPAPRSLYHVDGHHKLIR